MKGEAGQATLELILSASLLLITILGTGWVLKAQWERGKCAFIVFERTHQALVGSTLPHLGRVSVRVWWEGDLVKGEGQCKDAHETVSFRQIEAW